MTRSRTILIMALAALISSTALAQNDEGRRRMRRGDEDGPRPQGRWSDDGERPRRGPDGERPGRDDGPRVLRDRRPERAQPPTIEYALRQLDLTEDQRVAIERILADHRAGMEAARRDSADAWREAMNELRAARQRDDEEAVTAIRRRLSELRPGGEERHNEVIRRIAAVLTRPQRQAFLSLVEPSGQFDQLLRALRGLDLTPVQMRQVRQIAADARTQAQSIEDVGERGRVWAEAQRKLVDLLTDEQRAELRRRIAGRSVVDAPGAEIFEGLDLSEAQREAVAAIHAEIRSKIAQAEPGVDRREAIREARIEARRRIFQEVLTDEQKLEMFEQMMRQRPRGDGPPARPDGERRPARPGDDEGRGRRGGGPGNGRGAMPRGGAGNE